MEGIISKASSVFPDLSEPWRPPPLLHKLSHARPLCRWKHLFVKSFWTLKGHRIVLGVHAELNNVFISVVLVRYSLDVFHPARKLSTAIIQDYMW